MTRSKCNHKLTVFSCQPSNIINSDTERAKPNQPSHKNRLSESLQSFTGGAHPVAGHQAEAVVCGYFPAAPHTAEVTQKKMHPEFDSLNEQPLAILSSSKQLFLSSSS